MPSNIGKDIEGILDQNIRTATMDQKQAIAVVKAYKDVISEHYKGAYVYLYGSYSKGTAHDDSDIDVAVVLPEVKGDWFSLVPPLWKYARQVNSLIEPVLMEEGEDSPLYVDVMNTGIAV